MMETTREIRTRVVELRYFSVVFFISVADDAKLDSEVDTSEGRAILKRPGQARRVGKQELYEV